MTTKAFFSSYQRSDGVFAVRDIICFDAQWKWQTPNCQVDNEEIMSFFKIGLLVFQTPTDAEKICHERRMQIDIYGSIMFRWTFGLSFLMKEKITFCFSYL